MVIISTSTFQVLGYELVLGFVVQMFGLWGSVVQLTVGAVILISLPAYLVHRYLQTHRATTTVTTTTATTLINTFLSSPGLGKL